MEIHDDSFLWRTINETVGSLDDEILEKIYKKLVGTMWSIAKIEKLAEMYSEMY